MKFDALAILFSVLFRIIPGYLPCVGDRASDHEGAGWRWSETSQAGHGCT